MPIHHFVTKDGEIIYGFLAKNYGDAEQLAIEGKGKAYALIEGESTGPCMQEGCGKNEEEHEAENFPCKNYLPEPYWELNPGYHIVNVLDYYMIIDDVSHLHNEEGVIPDVAFAAIETKEQ